MKPETEELQRRIVRLIQEELDEDVTVTQMGFKEYHRGDPTVGDSIVTGGEIEMTAYVSYDEGPDDGKSDYRYDP